MKTIAILKPALLLLACVLLLPSQAHAAHDLRKFNVGSYVTGPKASGDDIKGKVVVVEYWGITCGPCIKAIPHTTELAKKYGHDKLVIIANQSWSASDRQTKEVWNKHAKNNYVMVVNGGKLPGYKPASVPRALIFDHTGKSVWEGHPGAMDRALADAIKNLPEPAKKEAQEAQSDQDTGPEPIITELEPEYFASEVRLINQQKRSIAAILAKLRRAAERSSRPEQVDEAKAIVTAVQAWANEQQAKAEASMADDPATAYTVAEAAVKLLGNDELAKAMSEIIRQIEKDAERFEGVRATIALRGVIAEAEKIGLPNDHAAADDRENARLVRMISRDLDRIIWAWPETDAAKQAATLLKDWGLDG